MSSLIAKVGKTHSGVSGKSRTQKSKKAAPRKQKKIVAVSKSRAAKSKKTVLKRTGKDPVPGHKVTGKKLAPKKKAVVRKSAKAASRRPAKRVVSSRSASRKIAAKSYSPQIRPAPVQPRKMPAPEAIAAVKAFENALKSFNRHDFASAKIAFESILDRFGDQAEVVAGVRTYLAICEQRLARAPSVPRSPDALYDRGVLEYNKGNIKDAIELFERALKSEPRADHIMYSLAAAYARMGNIPRTLDYLRRAIVIRPVHRSHARRDPDFTSLHINEDFQRLVGLGLDILE